MSARRFRVLACTNYDGDTFDVTLDLGFELVTHRRVRLLGVDTPELRGGTARSKEAGRLARDYARRFIAVGLAAGSPVEFVSREYRGKFGRPLGDIEVGGLSLVGTLIERRLGVPYDGQSKRDVRAAHDANLDFLEECGAIGGGR